MRTRIIVFLLFIISHTLVFPQTWLEAGFKINSDNPEFFYLDSVENWFYIGGYLYNVNGLKSNRIFRINSLDSIDLMDTISPALDPVLSMERFNDTLYFAGNNGLYTYENKSWKLILGNGKVFNVIKQYNGELLIGGSFNNLGRTDLSILVRYNGDSLLNFFGIDTLLDINYSSVYDIEVYKNKLYIAGNFQNNIGNYNEIMSWDGTNWDNLNGGIQGNSGFEYVWDLEVYNDELYVSGSFKKAWGSQSNGIIKWDGNSWSDLNGGLEGVIVNDMMVFKDQLWVTGNFIKNKNTELYNIAIWNGNEWCKPNGKFCDQTTCLGVFEDSLYIGGIYNCIDQDSTLKKCAIYNTDSSISCFEGNSIQNHTGRINSIIISPNPSNGSFFIEMTKAEKAQLMIYNQMGKLVYQSTISNRKNPISLNEPKGIYLLMIKSTKIADFKKIIIR